MTRKEKSPKVPASPKFSIADWMLSEPSQSDFILGYPVEDIAKVFPSALRETDFPQKREYFPLLWYSESESEYSGLTTLKLKGDVIL